MWKYFVIGALLLPSANAQPAKQKAQAKQQSSTAQVSPVPVVERQVETGDKPGGASEGQQSKQDDETKTFQRAQIGQYRVLVATNIITAAVLIVYTVFVGLQWRSVNKQEGHLSKQVTDTIKAQRAYITAKTALDARRGQLTLVIENSGNTPANDVRVTYSSGHKPNTPDSGPKYIEVLCQEMADGGGDYGVDSTAGVTDDSQGEIVPRTIYLGAIAPREIREEIVPQSLPTAADHSGGTIKFYYWGRIDYQDMFDKPRHTLFSFFRTLNEARPCETGNEIH